MFANQFTLLRYVIISEQGQNVGLFIQEEMIGSLKVVSAGWKDTDRVGVIKRYQKMKFKVSMGNIVITKKGYDVLTTVTGWGQGFQKWLQTNKSRIKVKEQKCEYNCFSLEWRALMNQPQ